MFVTITTMRRYSPLVGAASLALVLAACGGGTTDSTTDTTSDAGATDGGTAATLSGQLNGAGASSQAAAQQAWAAGIQAANPDLTVNYDPVGSGGGREQFIAGGVAFAGTDSALDVDEEVGPAQDRCGGGYIQVPAYISPIAIAFNLPGIDTLNLTPDVIAQIFDGKITNWNDPAITDTNPDAQLPDLAITVVSRSDESGTTKNFQQYLAEASGGNWPYEPDDVWPVKGGEAAQGTSGVVQAIQAGEGTIGYADESQVGDLGQVSVGVGDEFVPPNAESAAAIVAVSEPDGDRPEGDLALSLKRDTNEPGVYPVVLVSYLVACQTYDDAQTATNVKGYFSYVISPEGQQAAAETAGSAPLSEETTQQAEAAVALIQTG